MTFFEETVTQHPPKMQKIGEGKFGAMDVTFPPTKVRGVMKFAQFTTDKLRGIPKNTMHRREVAAYRLDRDVLRFNIVPPAALVRFKGTEASISEFVDGLMPSQVVPDLFKDDDEKAMRMARFWSKVSVEDAAKIVVFDLIVNNTDRHGRNVIVRLPEYGLTAIDHGLAFGKDFNYYRNVIHRYLFLKKLPVPGYVVERLHTVRKDEIISALSGLLEPEQIEGVWARLQFVLRRIDKLDFHTLSDGQYGKNEFPSYRRELLPDEAETPGQPELLLVV